MKPIASVIIDNYNNAHFIEESIDSVLNQTFSQSKIEIIVVDDGSTDNSKDKILKYKDKVKYIFKENGGQASALNAGIEIATGEYIIFLDSDDFCKKERIEKIINEFENYQDVVLIINSRHIITKEGDIFEKNPRFHDLKLDKATLKQITKAGYGSSRTSIRKNALKNILPIPNSLKIEADLYFLSLLWYGNISSLNEHLTVYRIHENNLFHSCDMNKIPLKIKSISLALEEIRKLISTFSNQNSEILNKLLMPYEVEKEELKLTLLISNNNANKKDLLNIELKKLNLNWEYWNNAYKIYKLCTLPMYAILPPSWIKTISDFYSHNKLSKYRDLLFPLR